MMFREGTFIIYRNSVGAITHYAPVPRQITYKELADEVKRFNERRDGRATACIVEVAGDSFEAYLLKQLDTRHQKDAIETAKNAIRDARDAIEAALDCINSLIEVE